MRVTGTVISWNTALRFGWIRSPEMSLDVHVDFTAIQDDPAAMGLRKLSVGETVEFDVQSGDRGPRAINVKVMQTPATSPQPKE